MLHTVGSTPPLGGWKRVYGGGITSGKGFPWGRGCPTNATTALAEGSTPRGPGSQVTGVRKGTGGDTER